MHHRSDTGRTFQRPLVVAGAIALLAIAALAGMLKYEPPTAAADTTYQSAILADNPSAYYRLGESSGLTAVDSSANAMDGAYSASDVTYGVTGALLGDADTAIGLSASGAMVAGSAIVPASTDAATYELWLRTTAGSADLVRGPAFSASFSGNSIYLYPTGTTVTLAQPINDGAWHLLDITYDSAGNVSVWVDGAPGGSAPIGTAGSGAAGLTAGYLGVFGLTAGDFDEVAVYPSVLSPTRIFVHWTRGASPTSSACAAAPTGPYAAAVLADDPALYLRLDDQAADPAGLVAFDSSGHCTSSVQTNGQYRPGIASQASGAIVGDSDAAVTASSSTGRITDTAATLPASTQAATYELWLRTTAGSADLVRGPAFSASFSNNNLYLYPTGTTVTLVEPINDGAWHLLDITYDGAGNVSVWVDAAPGASANIGSGGSGAAGLTVGYLGVFGLTAGDFDEVAVYPTALSSTRITSHWTLGASHASAACAAAPTSPYAQSVLADTPTVYLRLDDLAADPAGRVAFDSSGHCANGAYKPGIASLAGGALLNDASAAVSATSAGGQITAGLLPTSTQAATYELWLRTTAPYADLVRGPAFNASLYSNGIYFYPFGAVVALSQPINDGAWHLLHITYDGAGNVVVWVDASPQGSANIGTGGSGAAGLTVGYVGVFGLTAGDFDEVAVYPSVLPPSRIFARWTRAASPASVDCAAAPTSPYAQSVLTDTPAVYLRLDDLAADPAGLVAFDSSGHCANGAYKPGIASLAGGALLNDASTAVTATSSTGRITAGLLPASTQAATYELWFRSTAPYSDLIRGPAFSASFSGNNIYFYPFGAVVALSQPINDGAWHLLDITDDGAGNLRVWMDASPEAEVHVDPAGTGAAGLTLGHNIAEFNYASGDFDEAAVYPSVLPPSRIFARWTLGASPASAECVAAPTSPYALSVLTDAPTVYLRLDDLAADPAGLVAFDSSGHCANGAYKPGIASLAGGALLNDTSAAVTATSSTGRITAGLLPASTQAATYEVWFRSTAAYSDLLRGPAFSVASYGGGLYVGAYGYVGLSQPINDGNWHLLDITDDGAGNLGVWMDASPEAEIHVDPAGTGAAGLTLGYSIGLFNYASGDFDEAAVYPSALTPTRIFVHWTLGASPTSVACAAAPTSPYALSVRADNPSVYLRLDDQAADPAGLVAYDSSGHCTPDVQTNGRYRPGIVSQPSGAVVDDSDAAVTASTSQGRITDTAASLPASTQPATYELWFRSTASYSDLVRGPAFSVSFSGNSLYLYPTGTTLTLAQPINDGAWHLLDITYDGAGNVRVWVDASPQGSANIGTGGSGAAGLTVGYLGVFGLTAGDFDEVAVYPSVLPAVRIFVHATHDASVSIVNSSNDADDGTCDGAHCSLREAINAANATAGTGTILFAIGSGAVTISPTSALPQISDPVIIDGTTQPGFAGVPLVRIDGASAGTPVNGLVISAGNSTVRGLMITGFRGPCSACGGNGIELTTAGNDTIAGNYIGTDGTSAFANESDGIFVHTSAGHITIGGSTAADRNVISGNGTGTNGGSGIEIKSDVPGSPSDYITIQGNYIGTNATATAAVGNVHHGIELNGSSHDLIGGTTPGERNVVSGNGNCNVGESCTVAGILIGSTNSNFDTVEGNYVGVDVTGTVAIQNKSMGIVVGTAAAGGNVIGGTAGVLAGGACTGACNLVSGNEIHGILLSQAKFVTVEGNFVGTDVSGTLARPNGDSGIVLSDAEQNTIGGGLAARNLVSGNGTTNAGQGDHGNGIFLNGTVAKSNALYGNYIGTKSDGMSALPNLNDGVSIRASAVLNTLSGNLISGNGLHGVEVFGASPGDANYIQGNFIGTNVTGFAGLPNAVDGVRIQVNSVHVLVGLASPGAGNVIAFNTVDGVHVVGTVGTSHYDPIRGNNIFSNGNLGIELTNGGNDNLAPPTIADTVGGTACANCEIDVFSTSTAQGRRYEGSTTADGSGNWTFTGSIVGPLITATATDAAGNGSSNPCSGLSDPHECGNTSPFAAPVLVTLNREVGSPNNPGFAGDGGVATSALINGPHGLFLTAGNVLYFADTGNSRIRTVSPNSPTGTVNTVAGCCGLTPGYNGDGIAATSAQLSSPTDVFVAPSGDFFIADTNNCRIRKVSGGTISTVAGTGTCGYNSDNIAATNARINKPRGVAVDASGNVLIADTENNRIRKVTTSTGMITTVAGTGSAAYYGDGVPSTAAILNRPYDVYPSPSGGYVIADTGNSRVRRVSSGGIITTIAGTGGTGYNGDNIPAVLAQLNAPEAIAVETTDDVFVADSQNNRIRIVSSTTNRIETVVGNGQTGTSPDLVDAHLATLNQPAGIADGTLATSDTGNQTIRTTAANGDPTTTEQAPASRPSTFCREGAPGPVGALADWSVIGLALGMIATRKRLRMLVQFLVRLLPSARARAAQF